MVKSTWTDPTSSGWHIGTRSAVRLAAWMPATRAAASTSPLVMALLATWAVVSGFMATRHRARARRRVASLGETSTMRVPPNGSRWLKLRSVTVRLPSFTAPSVRERRPGDGIGTRSGRLPAGAPRPGPEGARRVPTYEYRCDNCAKNFDVVQSFHDDPLDRRARPAARRSARSSAAWASCSRAAGSTRPTAGRAAFVDGAAASRRRRTADGLAAGLGVRPGASSDSSDDSVASGAGQAAGVAGAKAPTPRPRPPGGHDIRSTT